MLPQIFPLFPENIVTFADLFCGGCNVGINVDAEKVLLNDGNKVLIGLLRTFRKISKSEIFQRIDSYIRQYGLSDSALYGYGYYNADSSSGLAEFNRAPFSAMRDDFNSRTEINDDYFILLYVIIVFSFNNQIRFNKDGKYNLPVGKRDFNPQIRRKLSSFIDRIQMPGFVLKNRDFRMFRKEELSAYDLVYADPPYLITCASYNEQGGWGEGEERRLLSLLDEVHNGGGRFALSNVLESGGKKNLILKDWLEGNKDSYTVHHLNYHYSNSSYQKISRTGTDDEVLIVNYQVKNR